MFILTVNRRLYGYGFFGSFHTCLLCLCGVLSHTDGNLTDRTKLLNYTSNCILIDIFKGSKLVLQFYHILSKVIELLRHLLLSYLSLFVYLLGYLVNDTHYLGNCLFCCLVNVYRLNRIKNTLKQLLYLFRIPLYLVGIDTFYPSC